MTLEEFKASCTFFESTKGPDGSIVVEFSQHAGVATARVEGSDEADVMGKLEEVAKYQADEVAAAKAKG